MKPQKILILGYGTLGASFAGLYHQRYDIRGLRRSPLPDQPCPLVITPIQSEALRAQLEWADVVLFCPSSGRGNLDLYRETYLDNMHFLIETVRTHNLSLSSIILIGSTGVYPRALEKCWQEDDAIPEESERQKILLQTEGALVSSGLPYAILRCGGLYGEERGHFYRYIREGQVLRSEMSNQWLLLLHFDDLCGLIDRVIQKKVTGETFNAVDDSQLRRSELAEWIAHRWRLPIVEDGLPPASPERRISNQKLKAVLDYRFLYPSPLSYLDKGHPLFPLPSKSN